MVARTSAACVTRLRSNGVRFYRVQPDDVRIELVAAWKKENQSLVLRSFLELLKDNASFIRKKTNV